MNMKKVMKVIIDGKTIIVSDFFRKDAIKDILIFGGSGREVEEEVVLSNLDNTKKINPKRGKVVRREKVVWSLDEVVRLRELALQGTPTSAMAVIFRKKYHNVSNKLRSLGILNEYKKIREARAGRNNEKENIASIENSEAEEIKVIDNPDVQKYL